MKDDIIEALCSTTSGRRAGWGALVLMGLLLLMTLIKTPITWYHDSQLARGQADSSRPFSVNPDQTAQWIAELPERHLYGQALLEQTKDLPVTSLQLQLVGIVHAVPNDLSSVIISESGQPGRIYHTGDSLPVGVKVNTITQDGVILENNGRLEKLPLQRQPLSFQGMPKKLLREE